MRSLLLVTSALSVLCDVFSYNISPIPNIILNISKSSKNEQDSARSSYFGFSLNLRKTHIMIGAPRAYSTFENDKDIEEPGQVFKCTFDGHCEEFRMGQEKKYKNRVKNNQLFGFSMDGFETENDNFVACAPKHAVNEHSDYYMIGSCYYVKNTVNNSGNQSIAIEPLMDPNKFYIDRRIFGKKSQYNERGSASPEQIPYYSYGESGFSAHIPNSKDEVIIGSPGVLTSLGTVSKFIFKSKKNSIGDVSIWFSHQNNYLSEDSYFGYALTSGKFFFPKDKSLIYVASAPKRNNNYENEENNGIVLFFELKKKSTRVYNEIHGHLRGSSLGAGFGYALLSDDFNNDKKPDLIVSAPFYAKDGSYDNGVVYIYINQGSTKKVFKI